LNADAERFVRSIKSECLRQITPLGERHLRRAVREYTEHYDLERNHQGLENEPIERCGPNFRGDGPVEIFGGVALPVLLTAAVVLAYQAAMEKLRAATARPSS